MDGLSGSLSILSLRDLARFLSHRQLSGTLHVNNGVDQKIITIRDGSVVMVSASSPQEYFSTLLVNRGYVDAAQIELALKRRDQPLGFALIALGALDEAQIREALTLKISETMGALMKWTAGSFEFVPHHSANRRDSIDVAVELQDLIGVTDLVEDGDVWTASPTQPTRENPSKVPRLAQNLDKDSFPQNFRREVDARLNERGRGKRFPRDLQHQAVAYYRARKQQGSFLSEVARELGLPVVTLRRWAMDAPRELPEPRQLPAASNANLVVDSLDPNRPVLLAPNGMRIEGLDLTSIAELLRRI